MILAVFADKFPYDQPHEMVAIEPLITPEMEGVEAAVRRAHALCPKRARIKELKHDALPPTWREWDRDKMVLTFFRHNGSADGHKGERNWSLADDVLVTLKDGTKFQTRIYVERTTAA